MKFTWDEIHLVAFDATLRKPGCVLLQAGMGGDAKLVSRLFNVETWLLAPTDNMKLYSLTTDEWEKVAAVINKEQKKT